MKKLFLIIFFLTIISGKSFAGYCAYSTCESGRYFCIYYQGEIDIPYQASPGSAYDGTISLTGSLYWHNSPPYRWAMCRRWYVQTYIMGAPLTCAINDRIVSFQYEGDIRYDWINRDTQEHLEAKFPVSCLAFSVLISDLGSPNTQACLNCSSNQVAFMCNDNEGQKVCRCVTQNYPRIDCEAPLIFNPENGQCENICCSSGYHLKNDGSVCISNVSDPILVEYYKSGTHFKEKYGVEKRLRFFGRGGYEKKDN